MGKETTAKHCSGRDLRVEPSHHDIFDIYPEIGEKFRKAGWMPFIRTLNGYHPQVAMAFAQTFDGFQAQVGGLTMYISEGTIAETFKLDIIGDRWFKKGKIDETLLNQFLPLEFQNPDWSKALVYHELCCYGIDENIFLVDARFDLRPELDAQAKQRRSRKKLKIAECVAKQSSTPQEQGEHQDLPPRISEVIPKAKATSSKMLTEVTPKTRITRARNKFRLNSKALFKPALKSTTPVDVDSDTPAKTASKEKVGFYMTPENPLFQLAQAAEVVEETMAGLRHGEKIKVTVEQGINGRLNQSIRTPKHDDGKVRRGKKHRA